MTNRERIVQAARLLGPLKDEMLFTGGAVTGLLVTDPAAPPPRPTFDIDVIVETASRGEYYRLSDRLRGIGFREDGEVICRWLHDDLILDVMPTVEGILGFTNRWYGPAFEHAARISLDSLDILMVTPPYFLGTKIEAFHGRGNGDFMASRDLEDIVTVIDGRPGLVDEVRNSAADIRTYLTSEFGRVVIDDRFLDALPGFLPPDPVSQQRAGLVLDRMRAMGASR